MKKGLKFKALAFLTAMTCLSALPSCSILGNDAAITISQCVTETLPDGSVKVTIIYENEDKAPSEFTIPAAVGVAKIATQADEKGNVTVTITTTAGQTTSFVIGAAVSIIGCESSFNVDGDTLIYFLYSDGTRSQDPVIIRRGEKGEQGEKGTGIDQIYVDQKENGETEITIFLTDNTKAGPFTIPPGVGIANISFALSEDGLRYEMVITLTDGTELRGSGLSFNRLPGWTSGQGDPDALSGVEGDFYFDTDAKAIYRYNGFEWILIVNFSGQADNTKTTVRFNLNAKVLDGEGNLVQDDSAYIYFPDIPEQKYADGTGIVIGKGHTFYDAGFSVPMATRDGYEFVGWYTDSVVTPVSGRFDALTAVWRTMDVYACWKALD